MSQVNLPNPNRGPLNRSAIALTAALGCMLLNPRPALAQWAACTGAPAGSLCLGSGNVGIGTTSPGWGLHLYGAGGTQSSLVTENSTQGVRAVFGASGWAPVGVAGTMTNHDFVVRTNSLEALRVTAAGNVGVGTTNPGAKLEVNFADSYLGPFAIPTLILKNTDTTIGNYASIRNVNSGGGANAEINFINTGQGTYPNNGGAIGFSTYDGLGGAGTTKMLISPAGNVGIGTTSPTANLELWGGSPSLKITQNPGQPGNSSLAIMPAGINNTATISLSGAVIQASTVSTALFLQPSGGNVGIGTIAPTRKLDVNGTIGAREVVVTSAGWADYVFKAGYKLRPLAEVAAFIKENGRLPEIPSETEVKQNGVSMGEMQAKLLAKVEELTLHMIEEYERNIHLEERNTALQERIERLEARQH